MLGNLDGNARSKFFQHIKHQEPWRDHPWLTQDVDFQKLVPIVFHADGAQFYRDDENFVWSCGSAFGAKGHIRDVLLLKLPFAIIPERFMQDKDVSLL